MKNLYTNSLETKVMQMTDENTDKKNKKRHEMHEPDDDLLEMHCNGAAETK